MKELLKKSHVQNSKTSLFKVSRLVFIGDKPDDVAAASEEPEPDDKENTESEEKGVEGKASAQAKGQKVPEDEELSDEGKKIKQRQAVEKAVLEAEKKAEHLGISGAEYFDMEKFPGLEEKGYKSKIVVSMPEDPEKFKDKPPRVIFYFHGKNGNAGGSYQQIKQQVEDMRNEGENVILVAPQDDGENQWNEFDKGDAFKDMQKMVEQVAGGKPIRDISIASFSGGYYGVNKVLKNLRERAENDPQAKDLYGRIKHLGFLDSTYGGESTEEFAKWAAADKNNDLAVTYSHFNGSESEAGKNDLVKALAARGVKEDRYRTEELTGGHQNAPKDFGRLMSRERSNIPEEKAKEEGAIPERAKDAMGGKEIMEKLKTLAVEERPGFIRRQFEEGNIPDFLRNFSEITVEANGHSAKIKVMPDYLALGDNGDFTRIPMDPITAQYIAEKYGCTLPTSKIVDDIEANATKLTFVGGPTIAEHVIDPETGMPCSAKWNPKKYGAYEGFWMMTPDFAQAQNDLIEEQHAPRTLVAGHKKDVVYTPGLTQKRGVGIYLRGIQPEAVPHEETYADYSHGIRLVKGEVTIDGQEMDLADALKNPEYASMFNKGGVMDITSMYRGNLAKAVDAGKIARTPLSLRETPGRMTQETPKQQPIQTSRQETGYISAPAIANFPAYAQTAGPVYAPAPTSAPASPQTSETPKEKKEGAEYIIRGSTLFLGDSNTVGSFRKETINVEGDMKTIAEVGKDASWLLAELKKYEAGLNQDKWPWENMVVTIGVNGIGMGAEKDFNLMKQIWEIGKRHGVKVYAGTLAPFKGWGNFDANYEKYNQTRKQINKMIRESHDKEGIPDVIIPYDELAADPSDPDKLSSEYNSGDHLHMKKLKNAQIVASIVGEEKKKEAET